MTKGKHCFPSKPVFCSNLLVKTYLFPCTLVLMIGFELVHQLNISLQPKAKYGDLDLNVVMALVAVPRVPCR